MEKMKIKDISPTKNLGGVKVKTHEGKVGYWKSQWGYPDGKAGVWLSNGITNQIHPQFLDSLEEALEWEVVGEDVEINL